MHATEHERPTVGDVVVVGGHAVGREKLIGEILEIRGEPGHERFLIRWEDGHESLYTPADGDATVHHYAPQGAAAMLMDMLRDEGIAFEPRRHPRTLTALDEAHALHARAHVVGKTIIVHTPAGMARVVIPASERLSLPKLRDELDVDDVRFATEEEIGEAYPAFELGAVPPFGGPVGETVVVDRRIAALDSVIVEAGSHSDSVRLAPDDLIRLSGAAIGDVVTD